MNAQNDTLHLHNITVNFAPVSTGSIGAAYLFQGSTQIASASVSGFPVDRFLFLGFPPIKNKRKKFFEEAAGSNYPVIFYESPYRIIKTLKELSPLVGDREIVVCRELTKKFETIYRGNISEVVKKIETDVIKGEFAVIVGK